MFLICNLNQLVLKILKKSSIFCHLSEEMRALKKQFADVKSSKYNVFLLNVVG